MEIGDRFVKNRPVKGGQLGLESSERLAGGLDNAQIFRRIEGDRIHVINDAPKGIFTTDVVVQALIGVVKM